MRLSICLFMDLFLFDYPHCKILTLLIQWFFFWRYDARSKDQRVFFLRGFDVGVVFCKLGINFLKSTLFEI